MHYDDCFLHQQVLPAFASLIPVSLNSIHCSSLQLMRKIHTRTNQLGERMIDTDTEHKWPDWRLTVI